MDLSSYTVEAITRRRPLASNRSSYESIPSSSSLAAPTGATTTSHQEGNNNVTINNKDNIDSATTPQGLRRSLGLVDVIFYGVGCSVGAGIYSLVGIGANLAGPAIAVSFAVCGIACCFTSLAYAEFAARVPLAGSAYTFTYVSFGELCAWLVGWNLTLGYAVSAAVVAQSWAQYLVGFLHGAGWTWPVLPLLTKFPIPWLGEDYTCCPLSIVIIGLCTIILVTGVKESTRFNTAMTLLNLSILLFVLLAGANNVDVAHNLLPVFPHGLKGMARGAGLVFFSYLGFDMVACLSEECQNPNRNMPRGIIGSLLISMTIYVSVAVVVVGMAPIDLLGPDTPITNALLANACCTSEQLQQLSSSAATATCLSYAACDDIVNPILYVGSRFISFGAIFGLTTATFACLMGQPRINYAAAQDGLLFSIFARVHPRTGVPTVGTILTGIFTAIVACFIDLEVLANAISLGTLQVFSFINAGVIVLRMRGATALEDTADASVTSQHEQTAALLLHSWPSFSSETESERLARSLGLVGTSSREIRRMVQESESQQSRESTTPTWLVFIFTMASILASLGATNDWHEYMIIGCLILMVVSAISLFGQPKSMPPETFTCPFVPTVPLLGILCNAIMMGALPLSTWWVILSWLTVGLVFYLAYGIHHSELKKQVDGNVSM